MATKAKDKEQAIDVVEIVRGEMTFCIVGTTPFICNRMSEKARRELLAPKGKKNDADKAANAKHDPIKEFRDSPYLLANDDAPTYVGMLPTAFKGAMRTAALDTPGAKKTQIGRLVTVPFAIQPLYGLPQLFMAVTRSSDMKRTPDVRTRAILPEWACRLSVSFVKPILKEQPVANLLAAGGVLSGVGDWRQEKGSASFGCFKLVSEDDPDFVRITTTQGRAAQIAAFDNPVAYDEETESLLSWFDVEARRRGFKVAGGSAA